MTRFFLIRHAITDVRGKITGRAPDVPLNACGRAQAERLARRLAGEKIAALYSSPQLRTWQTADALAAALDREVQIAGELDELDFGEWTGRTFLELEASSRWRAFNSFRSCTRMPDGEHPLEVMARSVGFMERLRERHPGQSLALVSHGDVIRSALAYYLGLPLDLMPRLEVGPASLSIVSVGEDGPCILAVNHTFDQG